MLGFPLSTFVLVILCYSTGVLIGWAMQGARKKKAIEEAFRSGEEQARQVYEEQKKATSTELLEKLEAMKISLVSTYEAYEEAVETVDKRLSPGVKEKLTLTYTEAIDFSHTDVGSQQDSSYGTPSSSKEDDMRLPDKHSVPLTARVVNESTSSDTSKDSHELLHGLNSERPYSDEETGTDLFPR